MNGPTAKGPRGHCSLARASLSSALLAGLVVVLVVAQVLPPAALLGAVALVLFTIFWAIRTKLPSILLIFFAVLLLGVIVTKKSPKFRPDRLSEHEGAELSRKWVAGRTFDSKLPVVVHLVFDEMMSPGAITDDLAGGKEMRQSLYDFGARFSFRVYDSVYSRYFFSDDSLPNLFNPEYQGHTAFSEVFANAHGDPADNAYFRDMEKRGYQTVVFQTALIDFCKNASVDMCETFDSFDPGGNEDVGIDAVNQRASLWQTVIRAYQPSYTSDAGQKLLRSVYGLKGDVGVMGVEDRYDAQRFPSWFDRFAKFTASVPRGTHVFAHFMVPHSPYLLSKDCIVSGLPESGYYLSNYPASERETRRRQFYESYFAQLGCVETKLHQMMTAFEESETLRDATIVIHGDHGSRISSGNVLEDYSPRDFIDNYGTFFAVRTPNTAPGVDCEFVSLPEVFRRQMTGEKSPRERATPLPVLVSSRAANKAKIEAAMPLFGCAAHTASAAQ